MEVMVMSRTGVVLGGIAAAQPAKAAPPLGPKVTPLKSPAGFQLPTLPVTKAGGVYVTAVAEPARRRIGPSTKTRAKRRPRTRALIDPREGDRVFEGFASVARDRHRRDLCAKQHE